MASIDAEFDRQLRQLATRVGLTSWRALGERAGVPLGQIRKLRQGQLATLPLGSIDRLAAAVGCSRSAFLATFDGVEDAAGNARAVTDSAPAPAPASENHMRRWQRQALDRLESFLTFWPVAADRARRDAALPAQKLVPLVKPIETMLADWDVETIGAIGETVAFDPQQHQAIGAEPAPGALVRVTHCGYRHDGRLLFRAKVKTDGAGA